MAILSPEAVACVVKETKIFQEAYEELQEGRSQGRKSTTVHVFILQDDIQDSSSDLPAFPEVLS